MSDKIVHDAEYYIVELQNREKWAAEDADLEVRLAALREELPFDPLDFIKFNMPDALKVTQKVNAVD
jgi:hypothetical protein